MEKETDKETKEIVKDIIKKTNEGKGQKISKKTNEGKGQKISKEIDEGKGQKKTTGKIIPPVFSLDKWEEWLEIRPHPSKKGVGVFALRLLPANTRLPIEGREICGKVYKELEKKRLLCYVMPSGRRGVYIDAHPRYKGSEQWFAGRINEPSEKEEANLVAFFGVRPFLVTVRDIQPGEELMHHYGGSFKRGGYRPGKPAKRPAWLSYK